VKSAKFDNMAHGRGTGNFVNQVDYLGWW